MRIRLKTRLVGAAAAALLTVTWNATATALDWQQAQKWLASDGAQDDRLGTSIALSGDVALVGAPGDTAAYVYRFDGVQWAEEQKLVPGDGADYSFGGSVALSGGVALVGATSSAYVYRFDGVQWVEEQKLVASDGVQGDGFGSSVALSGDLALVGARQPWRGPFPPVSPGPGAAYVYRFDGTYWVEEQKLVASDGAQGDYFGASVALSGDVALVGAPQPAPTSVGIPSLEYPPPGAAYVYRFDGTHWVEEQKLVARLSVPGYQFGSSVALSGDVALVGRLEPLVRIISMGDDDIPSGPGSAYVYRFDGTHWVEEQKIVASDGAKDDLFGTRVALSGAVALVGARGDDDNGDGSGSAYVYRFDGVQWVEEQKVVASDGAEGDSFGGSVALSGDVALIGAPGDDDNGESSGSAYVSEQSATVNLKVNGIDAPYPTSYVTTPGPVRLTLDMTAGRRALDHYYFWWADGTYYWITPKGASTTPAPLATFKPVELKEVPLYDCHLPPGVWVFGWLMLDGSVSWDFVVVLVTTGSPGVPRSAVSSILGYSSSLRRAIPGPTKE